MCFGSKADAQLALRWVFIFFANGLSLAQCVKPFDLFSLAGVGCLDEISYKIYSKSAGAARQLRA